MPELAEVEYFRKQWQCGLGRRIQAVALHRQVRLFRRVNTTALAGALRGSVLQASEAHGKQMLFRFSGANWLGLHLGMTGRLRVEPPAFQPGRHDHLVLYQRRQALVFTDPRQFGHVLLHQGQTAPDWWRDRPASLTSNAFTVERMTAFLRRHERLPIKAALLLQAGFPGIGNWMADEVLWRARLDPRRSVHCLAGPDLRRLWRVLRVVCRGALSRIGEDDSDPPPNWLFQHRWERGGQCPRDGVKLGRAVVGGRTTAWCPRCQPS